MGRVRVVPCIDVLIAEDSPTQATRLKRILAAHGCSVRHATDGSAALAMMAEQPPDLVISDVVMPRVTGFELCRAVRADERFSDVPVILLTSLSEPSFVMEGLASGASNYLMKPYTEQSLLARVEQTLEYQFPSESTGSPPIDVRFDGKTYRLTADRSEIAGFLLSSFGDAMQKNAELEMANSQLREALRTITKLEARHRNLLESSAEALAVVALDGTILYANGPAFALFKKTPGMLEGSRFDFPLQVGTTEEITFEAEGSTVYAELRVTKTQWSGEEAYLASMWDMTENVRLREELRDLSLTDELTGLYNRRGFVTLVEQQLKVARRTGAELALMFMDMDGLKGINDQHGHAAGDDALVETAGLLRTTLRDSDVIARVGGDEFAVLLIGGNADGPEPAARLFRGIETRNTRTKRPYGLSLSLGELTIHPDRDEPLSALMAEADELMYAEKRRRKRARG